jgi:hypothetical protein
VSPLPLDKRARLIKLMQLAQSTNDYEALSALRAATRILHTQNLDWEALFDAIDERKIIAWENERGGTSFRPHSWAFDMDSEEPKRISREPQQKVILSH